MARSRPIAARPPRGRCCRRAGSPARDRAGQTTVEARPTSGPSSHRYTATASPKTSWSSSQVVAGPSPRPVRAGRGERHRRRQHRAPRVGWSGIRMPIVAGSPPRSHVPAARSAGHDDRERSRPQGRGEALGPVVQLRDRARLRDRGEEDRQREIGRPLLRLEHPGGRGRIVRTRSDAVHGVGREDTIELTAPRGGDRVCDGVTAHGRRPDTTRARAVEVVFMTRTSANPRRLRPRSRTSPPGIVVDLDGDRASQVAAHERASSKKRRYKPGSPKTASSGSASTSRG